MLRELVGFYDAIFDYVFFSEKYMYNYIYFDLCFMNTIHLTSVTCKLRFRLLLLVLLLLLVFSDESIFMCVNM